MITVPFMLATGMITWDCKINKDFNPKSLSPELKEAMVKHLESQEKLYRMIANRPVNDTLLKYLSKPQKL